MYPGSYPHTFGLWLAATRPEFFYLALYEIKTLWGKLCLTAKVLCAIYNVMSYTYGTEMNMSRMMPSMMMAMMMMEMMPSGGDAFCV